jgi:hypothetical protein
MILSFLRLLACILCLLLTSCGSIHSKHAQSLVGEWTIETAADSMGEGPITEMLALYPEGSWRSWYFVGGMPPMEWGDQASGKWRLNSHALILEHPNSQLLDGTPITVWDEFSESVAVDDKLTLKQDDQAVVFHRHLGQYDEYIAELNTD